MGVRRLYDIRSLGSVFSRLAAWLFGGDGQTNKPAKHGDRLSHLVEIIGSFLNSVEFKK